MDDDFVVLMIGAWAGMIPSFRIGLLGATYGS